MALLETDRENERVEDGVLPRSDLDEDYIQELSSQRILYKKCEKIPKANFHRPPSLTNTHSPFKVMNQEKPNSKENCNLALMPDTPEEMLSHSKLEMEENTIERHQEISNLFRNRIKCNERRSRAQKIQVIRTVETPKELTSNGDTKTRFSPDKSHLYCNKLSSIRKSTNKYSMVSLRNSKNSNRKSRNKNKDYSVNASFFSKLLDSSKERQPSQNAFEIRDKQYVGKIINRYFKQVKGCTFKPDTSLSKNYKYQPKTARNIFKKEVKTKKKLKKRSTRKYLNKFPAGGSQISTQKSNSEFDRIQGNTNNCDKRTVNATEGIQVDVSFNNTTESDHGRGKNNAKLISGEDSWKESSPRMDKIVNIPSVNSSFSVLCNKITDYDFRTLEAMDNVMKSPEKSFNVFDPDVDIPSQSSPSSAEDGISSTPKESIKCCWKES
ncbi:unnamed protein product [Moneuplotes crassus]|uniref:Uncharacterized protein n=1 Tax=Euplotes crassus TaxID=5936 RepID=A0AAD1UKT5_EUPCR|nr:unnamed protein product [Moneuplotes crassus]